MRTDDYTRLEDMYLADHQRIEEQVVAIGRWLTPVIAGGLSAGRTGTVHDTADRLAETILIGIRNTLAGNTTNLFQPQDEVPF